MRYQQLSILLKDLKPSSILEIGTWNGDRAVQMMDYGMVYFGFDLFEEGTPEDDYIEFNVKPHFRAEDVNQRLKFPHKLYRGYTKDTLPVFLEEYGPNRVDFAYIDGGHSLETIQTDFDYCKKIVKKGGVIVFDDYYPDAPQQTLDRVGANKILEGLDYTVLPDKDKTVEGFHVQLAMVINE